MWGFAVKREAREIKRLKRIIADLERQAGYLQTTLNLKDAEIDGLSNIIARDRARVASETAEWNHRRALSEGSHGSFKSSTS